MTAPCGTVIAGLARNEAIARFLSPAAAVPASGADGAANGEPLLGPDAPEVGEIGGKAIGGGDQADAV